MKTYIKTAITNEPKLIIEHDSDCESPRVSTDCNIGYFITKSNRYESPDHGANVQWVIDIMTETGDNATSLENHIELVTAEINATGEKVIVIYPITRYEHGNVSYRIGNVKGFDYSLCGMYIVTDKTLEKSGLTMTDSNGVSPFIPSIEMIQQEIDIYNQYCNGEVYRFTLLDDDGEQVDGTGGIYDIEEIREYIPGEEWKNENLHDYIID